MSKERTLNDNDIIRFGNPGNVFEEKSTRVKVTGGEVICEKCQNDFWFFVCSYQEGDIGSEAYECAGNKGRKYHEVRDCTQILTVHFRKDKYQRYVDIKIVQEDDPPED